MDQLQKHWGYITSAGRRNGWLFPLAVQILPDAFRWCLVRMDGGFVRCHRRPISTTCRWPLRLPTQRPLGNLISPVHRCFWHTILKRVMAEKQWRNCVPHLASLGELVGYQQTASIPVTCLQDKHMLPYFTERLGLVILDVGLASFNDFFHLIIDSWGFTLLRRIHVFSSTVQNRSNFQSYQQRSSSRAFSEQWPLAFGKMVVGRPWSSKPLQVIPP